MQLTSILTFAALAASATARLHSSAVCVNAAKTGSTGNGTPWGLGYGSYTDYELDLEATKCACGYYRNRNTGNKQWDKCPDCTFDGLQCNSAGWHIGGDEMNHYCRKYCGAEGNDGN
ncbi:hypothetical protein CkaCkLH20_00563 [Colletotrichum karsti]|uniref:Uncharacterized protein n=1 Tax=Colletotrichum karsti TaxID=1095194 RepID=A0A9P6LQY3_9PEZI|nr:uncharacterized protein CkaCkLH20_00563 [Colletotrichum karsti]KAF9881417.1 hypothetical protein CkaCkLH20_00563 [Colletotrichum karsti]